MDFVLCKSHTKNTGAIQTYDGYTLTHTLTVTKKNDRNTQFGDLNYLDYSDTSAAVSGMVLTCELVLCSLVPKGLWQ